MTFTCTKLEDGKFQLTVELAAEDLASHIDRAQALLGRDLEVDGFRKGKVPPDVVRKHIGISRILETALESAVQRSLAEIIDSNNFDVIEATDLKVQENSAEKLVYTVALQLFPDVTLPKLETISVHRGPVSVEPKEIDETIETIKSSRASVAEKDGPAETGDRVEVDFEVTENGSVIEGGISKNHPITIGAGNFVPGFEDQLIGMKKGDRKEFSLTAPDDFSNKAVAGKKLDFIVSMVDVKRVTLPELTDDFARSLGKFSNMDQLILSIKDGLLEEKKEKEEQRVRGEVLDKIVAGSTMVVPAVMIERQLDLMVQNFDQDLHKHDMELAMYLAKLNKTREQLRDEWRVQAERQVRMSLVLHAIARKQNISVAPEETNEALQAVLHSTVSPDGIMNLDADRIRQNIESRLLNEKTFEYIEKICVS